MPRASGVDPDAQRPVAARTTPAIEQPPSGRLRDPSAIAEGYSETGFFFAAGCGTQPRAAALENSFFAPQCLQVPTLTGPPGAGSIQWCVSQTIARVFVAIFPPQLDPCLAFGSPPPGACPHDIRFSPICDRYVKVRPRYSA